MKKSLLVLLVFLLGCSTTQVPAYLKSKNPYTKRFYMPFAETLAATTKALAELGWDVEEKVHPSVYEQASAEEQEKEGESILILTKVRQTPMFLGTRYARMNVYIRSQRNESEVEIRYLTLNSLPLRSISSYRNDSAADRILRKIEETLTTIPK